VAIPKVKDVMVRDVLKTDKNSTVLDIARMLDRHKLGAVIITDKNDFPEGIVSERDIIRAITAYGEKAVSVCACNIMSSPVLSLGPDADIESAASLMTENRIRRIPIVDDNRLIGLISYRDITNALRKSYFMLQEKTEILEEKANKDSLTGLYNKGYIVEQLKYHISLAERTRNPMAVIMLDIDYFKKINDTHGHLCGDRILKSIADILKEKSRAINRGPIRRRGIHNNRADFRPQISLLPGGEAQGKRRGLFI